MRRAIALVVITLIIVLVADITKPSRNECITEATSQYQQQVNSMVEAMPATVSKEVLAQTLLQAFRESLRVEDKLIYQEIALQKGNQRTIIGWGAFGHVSVTIK